MSQRGSNIIYTERHDHPGVDSVCRIEYVGDVVHKAVDEIARGPVIAEHVHLYYEFSIVTSGVVTYSVDGEEYSLAAGDMCITYPGELHQMTCPTSQEWRMLYMAVSVCRLSGVEALLQQSDQRVLSNCGTLAPDLVRILREMRERRFGYSDIVSLLAGMWLVEVCRRLCVAPGKHSSSRHSEAVRQARDYIEYRGHHAMSIDEIARDIGISRSHLSHLFTQEMGMPVCAYIREVVIQRARRMLRDRKLSVTEIADTLGFPSLHCFSAAFKRHQGMSPVAYRRQRQASADSPG